MCAPLHANNPSATQVYFNLVLSLPSPSTTRAAATASASFLASSASFVLQDSELEDAATARELAAEDAAVRWVTFKLGGAQASATVAAARLRDSSGTSGANTHSSSATGTFHALSHSSRFVAVRRLHKRSASSSSPQSSRKGGAWRSSSRSLVEAPTDLDVRVHVSSVVGNDYGDRAHLRGMQAVIFLCSGDIDPKMPQVRMT